MQRVRESVLSEKSITQPAQTINMGQASSYQKYNPAGYTMSSQGGTLATKHTLDRLWPGVLLGDAQLDKDPLQ